jgi:two-component system, sensor histidine kinase and response regulator
MDSESERGPSTQRLSARVAVVDDDALSSSMQAHLVSLLGHRAIVETDPEQAIERALDGQFDLMLLDLGMPSLNGFEALRRLRQREAAEKRRPVPVIAVTGYTSESDRLRCLMAGFADHVSKPIHADAFEIALRRALRDSLGKIAEPVVDELQSDADRLRASARRLADGKPQDRGYGPTMTEKFALRSQQLIESMQSAMNDRDGEQLTQGARAMKSLAELLGASRLASMCANLEQLVLTQQWNASERVLEEIQHGNQAMLTVLFESAR